jgi:hypothetical protein
MPAAPAMQRKAVGLTVMAVLIVGALLIVETRRLRRLGLLAGGLLAARDERWQPVDMWLPVALLPILLAATVVAAALLLMRAWHVGLVLRIRLHLGRQERLRLAGAERGVPGIAHRLLAELIVTFIVEGFFAGVVVRAGKMRIVLPELFLRRSDQAEIVLGVLIVVFRRYRIARRVRIAGELNVFFGDVRRRSTNFHVRAVRFEHPRHGILVLAMVVVVIIIVVVSSAHALVVLNVSHGLPVC